MIAWKTWREVRWMALVYLLLLQVLLVAAIAYWPHMAEQLRRSPFMEGFIPARFIRDWIANLRNPDESVAYPSYLALQHFFKGVNLVGIACAVLVGTGAVAKERETGTLEFLLSRPIGKGRILITKSAVLALCVVAPIFLTSASAVPLSRLIDAKIGLGPLMLASLHGSLFVLNFLFLTILLSTLLRTQVHVAFAIGGFIIVQAGIYFVQVLRSWSLFLLADFQVYGPILAGNVTPGRLFLEQHLWLILSAALLQGAALFVMHRRDL